MKRAKRKPVILGRYTAGDLHRAFQNAMARAERRKAAATPVGCDVRPDGRLVAL